MTKVTRKSKFNPHNIIKLDVENFHFCPAISHATRNAIGRSTKLCDYMDIRGHFTAYATKAKENFNNKVVAHDNTLTSYYETDEAISSRLGISRVNCNKWITSLCKVGLVVRLPFAQNGMPRRNLVVLDYGMTGYIEILESCLVYLNRSLKAAHSKGSSKGSSIEKQISYINTAINNHADIVENGKKTQPQESIDTGNTAEVVIRDHEWTAEATPSPITTVDKYPNSEVVVIGLSTQFKALDDRWEFSLDADSSLYVLQYGDQCIETYKTIGNARRYLEKLKTELRQKTATSDDDDW